jgi:TIR domain/Protein of unknown function (DUF3298)
MALKVFISYAREDRARVEIYFEKLAQQGYDPWMDYRKILPGQNWEAEIEHALASANVVVAFLSKSSVSKRGFVQREVNFALDRLKYKLPTDIYLIPLLLEPCDVPVHLSNRLQYIDLSVNQAWEQVIASLNLAAEQQQIAAIDGVRFGPFRVVTRSSQHRRENREILIEYPEFLSDLLPQEATELSSFFETRALRGSPTNISTEVANHAEDEAFEADEYWENFELTHASDHVVSVGITISHYFHGAAHPNHSIETFNFLISGGVRRLQLHDLFINPAAAEEVITTATREELFRYAWESYHEEPSDTTVDWIESGTAPHCSKFNNFRLMADRLVVTFSPYEVAPYSMGFQSVEIPYFRLRHLLRPDGPHALASRNS